MLDFIEDDLKSKLKEECTKQENLKNMNFVIEEPPKKKKFQRFTSFTDSKSLARVEHRMNKRGFQLKQKLFLSSKKNYREPIPEKQSNRSSRSPNKSKTNAACAKSTKYPRLAGKSRSRKTSPSKENSRKKHVQIQTPVLISEVLSRKKSKKILKVGLGV